ncbi:MAG: class I SAM-dependent methyltransferase [Pseudomonadota bacterium]
MLFYLDILKDHSGPLEKGAKVLDFGAGAGEFIRDLKNLGYDAYGCDIITYDQPLVDQSYLKLINQDPYRIPYDDNSFDAVFSNMVFEHVQNYDEALKEIHRVLKPGGRMLHIFPPRLSFIELHILSPFAAAFHPKWYLSLWAKAGVRNSYQTELSAKDTVESNMRFLDDGVNYLPRTEIQKHFETYFSNFSFVKKLILKYGTYGHIQRFRKFLLAMPFSGTLYDSFVNQVVYAEKSRAI